MPNVKGQMEDWGDFNMGRAVRAGLRLLEEKEVRLAALRRALEEGENSGFATYSIDRLMMELDKERTG